MQKPFRKLKIVLLTLALSTLGVDLSSCGGGGGGSNTISANNVATAQFMMGMISFLRARSTGVTPPSFRAMKIVTQNCQNGGSFTLNDDGSITFNNCSFVPGQIFNGTMKFTHSPDGTQDSVTFQNFNGQNDDKLFQVDGTLTERRNSDGSMSFEMDIDSSVTDGGGNTDTTNVTGLIEVDPNFGTTGTMRLDVNDLSTQCDFSGQDLRDLAENTGGVYEQACQEQEGGPPS